MPKIGRNQLCPCGSGKKYKHCCLRSQPDGVPVVPAGGVALSLKGAIADIQRAAAGHLEQQWRLGVFLFFATCSGDAWVLEVTGEDGIQVARAGEPLEVPVREDGEVIEIDWTHRFRLQQRELHMIPYRAGAKEVVYGAPAGWIRAGINKVLRECSPELLARIHVDDA